MFCRKCGAPLEVEDRFCESCGAPATTEPETRPAQLRRNRKILFALGIGAAAFAVFGVLYLRQGGTLSFPQQPKSATESLVEFVVALSRADEAKARDYLTQRNLEYLDQRSRSLDIETSSMLLDSFFPNMFAPWRSPEFRRRLARSLRVEDSALVLAVKEDPEGMLPERISLLFEGETVIGDRAVIVAKLISKNAVWGERSTPIGIDMTREDGRWKPTKVSVTDYGPDPILLELAWLSRWFLRRGMAANESSAVGSLRTINTACVTYSTTYRRGFPPSLAALGPPANGRASVRAADLIDSMVVSGVKSGYRFAYVSRDFDGNGTMDGFTVNADPISRGTTGGRSFFIDQSGVIRWNRNGSAGPYSRPLS